jgi:hypothetical protein
MMQGQMLKVFSIKAHGLDFILQKTGLAEYVERRI